MDRFKFRVYYFLLAALLLVKLCLFIYFPMPNIDGPWSLSQTFSILSGHFFESSFAHSYMGFYNLPYMGSLINAPFYLLFAKTSLLLYSIFLLNIVWICTTLAIVHNILKKTGDRTAFFLFAFSFVLSIYTYSLRPEIFLLPFLLWLQVLMDKNKAKNNNTWLVSLVVAVIGLSHPVGGFYAVFFICIYALHYKIKFTRLLLLLAGIGITVALLYGPVILYDVQLWQLNFFHRGFENDTRHIDLSYPFKFYFYSVPFAALTVFNILQTKTKERVKEIFYLVACIALLMLFMRSYYFPYLFHFVFWRVSLKKEFKVTRMQRAGFVLAMVAGMFLCFAVPIYQLTENNIYRDAFTKILDYTKPLADKNPDKRIWLPPDISMGIIDQPNARLYIPSIEHLSGVKQISDTNTIYLVHSKGDIAVIQKFSKGETDSMIIKQVYEPVKGLIRIGNQHTRTDSLGLWEISFAKK